MKKLSGIQETLILLVILISIWYFTSALIVCGISSIILIWSLRETKKSMKQMKDYVENLEKENKYYRENGL